MYFYKGSLNLQSLNRNVGLLCGSSSVGRASPCQGEGREFESRFPLRQSPLRGEGLVILGVSTGSRTGIRLTLPARVVKSVDTQDLKSCGQKWLCGFKSRPGYQLLVQKRCFSALYSIMKKKDEVFISSLILYSIIFLAWHGWSLNNRQLVELMFIGTLSSLTLVLTINPLTRVIQSIVRKMRP